MELSVVIPTYNEASFIEKCIDSLKNIEPQEILVIDGGSLDNTVAIATLKGARVIESERGRGKQIKKGVEEAKGDIILIIHADAYLSNDITKEDFRLYEGFCAGFFRLKYDSNLITIKLVEFFANLRSILHSLPYGDQAIFVKKEALERIGGIKDYPFLEDIDLVLRLREVGRLKAVPKSVLVSSRKLLRGGFLYPIFHSFKNFIIVILFFLGFSPDKLIKFYR
ncbi:MAG: TIGR04283 family arsenosugar biosynthesis glycosyltransferase [Proteobacteria bacterium]|nr:TIGR04283 family arsenosugar biosynthesis glycosyltransferase [Pseudomonadota bacterium]